MSNVTVIITSCNRIDLLDKTLDSFMKFNTYPIKEYLLHNDGPDTHMDRIKKKFPFIQYFYSPQRVGYSKSLDLLLSKVTTEWVWTNEDDWTYHRNPGFIERSMQILNDHPHIQQVWVRDQTDFTHPLGDVIVLSGHEVRPVIPGYHKLWNGFSLNCGLRRMSDLKKWFPNGLAEYGDEIVLAKRTAEFNYKAVSLVNASMKHAGWNRRSINFKP